MVFVPSVVLLEIGNLDITAVNAFEKVQKVIAWRNKTHAFELIPQINFPRVSDRTLLPWGCFCLAIAKAASPQRYLNLAG